MRLNVASVLSGRPLLITEQGLQLVLAVVSRDELFAEARHQALAARDGEPLENAHRVVNRDGVAVLQVHGPLFRFASLFTEISGATSYDTLRKDLALAESDPDVKAILLDVNSPGGDADGCGELAEAIANCSKPVWAYVGGLGASAAYWIATAADRVICAPTAFLGSIGVRTALVDTSEKEKRDGVRSVEIISSNAPGKRDTPLDDEVVGKAQRHVDALEQLFVGAVAAQRGVSVDKVLADFGQGDVMIGAAAVAAGMADAVGNFESTLAELVAGGGTAQQALATTRRAASLTSSKGTHMKTKIKAEAPPEPGMADDKAEDKKDAPGCEDDGDPMGADSKDGDPEAADDEDEKKMADGDGDEDDKPAAEGDDDEKKMAAKLAAKLGLSPKASMKEILTAANAGSVPLSQMSAMVEKQVGAKFAAEKKMREKQEAKEKAEKLATAAIRGGYDAADRDALVAFATSNYAAAKRSVAHFLKANDDLFTSVAGSTATDRADLSAGTQVRNLGGGKKLIKYGCDFAQAAKNLAAKDGITVEAAQDRIMQTKEGRAMYAAYLESLS